MSSQKKAKKVRILLVDDEIDLRTMFIDNLSSSYPSWEIDEAVDGMDGLEKSKVKDYDLILTCLMMPKMDGMEMIEKLKARKNFKSKVIVLTNLTSDVAIKEAYNKGAYGYLIKTELFAEEIVDFLEKVIKHKVSRKEAKYYTEKLASRWSKRHLKELKVKNLHKKEHTVADDVSSSSKRVDRGEHNLAEGPLIPSQNLDELDDEELIQEVEDRGIGVDNDNDSCLKTLGCIFLIILALIICGVLNVDLWT